MSLWSVAGHRTAGKPFFYTRDCIVALLMHAQGTASFMVVGLLQSRLTTRIPTQFHQQGSVQRMAVR
jgi:hypothetical protein